MAQQDPSRNLPALRVLDRQPTFTTKDPGQAHEHVSELFCEHKLVLPEGGRELSMTLRSRRNGPIGLDLVDYHAPVRISPQALEDFHLIQIPLMGRVEIEVAGTTYLSDPNIASVPPTERDFSMYLHRGTPQLIVYVRRDEVQRVAIAMYGNEAASKLKLARVIDLRGSSGASFLNFVQSYHQDLNDGGLALDNEFSRSQLNDMLLVRFLIAANIGNADDASKPEVSTQPHSSLLVRRFTRLLQDQRLDEIGVLELAAELKVPLRTLQRDVRAELGETPTSLLRKAKLERARIILLESDPAATSVTEVAIGCGFSHLGRFATAYRALFGESPSETLRQQF